MANVDELVKAAAHASTRQQAVIDAAQRTAADIAANRPNAPQATSPAETQAAQTPGSAS